MIIIAHFIFLVAVVQLMVALANTIFRQPLPMNQNSYSGLISILIPARNEQDHIANLLEDLRQQDYENLEIIVFNDQSTDQTADIVLEKSIQDKRIRLVNSKGLPAGWLGKNHACHCLGKEANGEYYLFLDADVRIGQHIILNTILLARKYQLGLITIFPKQWMLSLGERLTVPNMNYILLSLLPLILVRKSRFPSLAAANGQFMLFNASCYHQTQPHQKVKDSKVEDIHIARYFKSKNISIACLLGNESITCRMYHGFADAINGFSKNVIMFFGNSFILAILFWFITTLGFMVVFWQLSLKLFLIYLLILILTRILISIVSKQNIFWNLLLFFPQQISLGLFILQAFINKKKRSYSWKDRNIS